MTDTDALADVTPSLPEDSRQPQHLILTLLGDYWLTGDGRVPSGALVRLLSDFSVAPTTARAALGRLTHRGLLEVSKVGRRTYYRLSDSARRDGRRGLDRIISFGVPTAWDGNWTFVAFSVPEEHRSARHQYRARLRWYRFAPLFDGLWVSPRPLGADIRAALAEVTGGQSIVVVGKEFSPTDASGAPIGAWDLSSIRARYLAFLGHAERIGERLDAGAVAPAEALIARTDLMGAWRRLPELDPDLPDELLPADWPRARGGEVFRRLYDDLGEPAALRVRQIVALHDDALVSNVRLHTTSTTDRDDSWDA
jgi:phenylacetic acid degradation operon negative regulatory protein